MTLDLKLVIFQEHKKLHQILKEENNKNQHMIKENNHKFFIM